MQKRTKFSIIFIITLFILITVAFIFAGKWTRDFQEFLTSHGSVEHATVRDVVITETKDGIKDWEVYAAMAEYDNDNVTATMHDIVGNYYKNGDDGRGVDANPKVPDLVALYKIKTYFNVPYSYLFGETTTKNIDNISWTADTRNNKAYKLFDKFPANKSKYYTEVDFDVFVSDFDKTLKKYI